MQSDEQITLFARLRSVRDGLADALKSAFGATSVKIMGTGAFIRVTIVRYRELVSDDGTIKCPTPDVTGVSVVPRTMMA